MEISLSPETIALMNEMHELLNQHNLSFKNSFMVTSYLTAVIANNCHMSKEAFMSCMDEVYDLEHALQNQEIQ
jgi:hypothetical protein